MDLPPGWERVADKKGGAPYFWNKKTNEVSWTKRATAAWDREKRGDAFPPCGGTFEKVTYHDAHTARDFSAAFAEEEFRKVTAGWDREGAKRWDKNYGAVYGPGYVPPSGQKPETGRPLGAWDATASMASPREGPGDLLLGID